MARATGVDQMILVRLKKLFLTPMGPRFEPNSLRKMRGMALFLVMISLALMTSVVSDLGYNETIHYKMALNQRDALKAEALAEGSINIARLFLIIQGKIQPYISTFASMGVPLPSYTIWEMLPLDGELLKGLTTGDLAASFGLEVGESLKERKEKKEREEKKPKPTAKSKVDEYAAKFRSPDGGYGAFDGSFTISIVDEESKISLRNWADGTDQTKREATRKMLASLFYARKYDKIFGIRGGSGSRVDRGQLIANIFDYADLNQIRLDPYAPTALWGIAGGGSEKDLYHNKVGVMPKNAYFDSLQELRLVPGISDDIMQAFEDSLTIYGNPAKVNILSAKDQVVGALVGFCAASDVDPLLMNPNWMKETVRGWRTYQKQGLGPVSPQGFVTFLETRGIKVDSTGCLSVLDVKSSNFTVKVSATVGDVTRTLTLVTRVENNTEELYYFQTR